MSPMEFICYSNWQQLPQSADELFHQGEYDSMFFSRPWFENLVSKGLEADQKMQLACVIDSNKVLAILPLLQESDNNWTSLSHRYSSLFSILLENKNREQILNCLVSGLKQLPFNLLHLQPFDQNDKNIQDLLKTMTSQGFKCHLSFRFYNWIYRINGETFNQYMAKRPAKVQNTIQRKYKKLNREHHCELQLFKGKQIKQAMADYHHAYFASWKANEQFKELLDGLAESFAEQDWSRLGVLYIDGEPAAAQLWFVVHAKASIFRLAYNEAWKKYSPGSILTRYLMQYVIDTDKVKEIDFLTGNEAYKQDWMSERRERWAIVCQYKQPEKKLNSVLKKLFDTFTS